LLKNAQGKLLDAFKILKAVSLTFPDGPEVRLDVEAFEGIGDSGAFQNDLTDLLGAVGAAAKDRGKVICFFIDELQYLKEDDFEAIMASLHRVSQRGYPVQFICAGLPQILAKSADAKSYAERQFDFIPLDRLKSPDDRLAITGPLDGKGIVIDFDAIDEIIRITDGYPYFIQDFGRILFELSPNPHFTLDLVLSVVEKYYDQLDDSFYKSRWDRTTDAEKKYMRSMARLDCGPYKSAEVAEILKRKPESVGPLRAGLIYKGFIYLN